VNTISFEEITGAMAAGEPWSKLRALVLFRFKKRDRRAWEDGNLVLGKTVHVEEKHVPSSRPETA